MERINKLGRARIAKELGCAIHAHHQLHTHWLYVSRLLCGLSTFQHSPSNWHKTKMSSQNGWSADALTPCDTHRQSTNARSTNIAGSTATIFLRRKHNQGVEQGGQRLPRWVLHLCRCSQQPSDPSHSFLQPKTARIGKWQKRPDPTCCDGSRRPW